MKPLFILNIYKQYPSNEWVLFQKRNNKLYNPASQLHKMGLMNYKTHGNAKPSQQTIKAILKAGGEIIINNKCI